MIYDGIKFNDDFVETLASKYKKEGYCFILPIRDNGSKGRWRWGYDSAERGCLSGMLFAKTNKTPTIYQIDEADDTYLPKTLWYGERFDASTKGTNLLKDIVSISGFDYPKSIFAVKDMIVIGSDESDIVLDYFAGSGTTAHAVINLNREDNGRRKYILVEMADYFDTVLKPRIQKVIYSESWKNGKPTARHTGVSHCFKYLRLESYEDTLNNLSFNNNSKAYQDNPNLYEDYMLRYLLDVETQGSQSLLNIDVFADPCAYKLKVKQPGSDEYVVKNVDLLETFNYLIGLRVVHIAAPLAFTAKFKREPDPELPENQQMRLIVNGRIKQDKNGPWWFRKVEGWIPSDPRDPNNGQKEKVLIVWRKLTGDLEQDNLMLDEWFQKNRISTRDFEFDTIYVNGSNNLPNLKLDDENWKVRLIEEEFMKRMWDVEGV
ncbi:MAG: DNA methyltransferase [Desulfobacteria bacterium]